MTEEQGVLLIKEKDMTGEDAWYVVEVTDASAFPQTAICSGRSISSSITG